MDSIQLKTKELGTYYCGCHGDLVTIATRYVAVAYCPKEPLYCHLDYGPVAVPTLTQILVYISTFIYHVIA